MSMVTYWYCVAAGWFLMFSGFISAAKSAYPQAIIFFGGAACVFIVIIVSAFVDLSRRVR